MCSLSEPVFDEYWTKIGLQTIWCHKSRSYNPVSSELRKFTLSASECGHSVIVSESAHTSFNIVKLKHSIEGTRRKNCLEFKYQTIRLRRVTHTKAIQIDRIHSCTCACVAHRLYGRLEEAIECVQLFLALIVRLIGNPVTFGPCETLKNKSHWYMSHSLLFSPFLPWQQEYGDVYICLQFSFSEWIQISLCNRVTAFPYFTFSCLLFPALSPKTSCCSICVPICNSHSNAQIQQNFNQCMRWFCRHQKALLTNQWVYTQFSNQEIHWIKNIILGSEDVQLLGFF